MGDWTGLTARRKRWGRVEKANQEDAFSSRLWSAAQFDTMSCSQSELFLRQPPGIATASPSTRLLAQRSAANSMALAHRAIRADPANEGRLPPWTSCTNALSTVAGACSARQSSDAGGGRDTTGLPGKSHHFAGATAAGGCSSRHTTSHGTTLVILDVSIGCGPRRATARGTRATPALRCAPSPRR